MKKLLGLLVGSAILFSCSDDTKPAEATESKTASASSATEARGYEFADARFVDIGKKHMSCLERGDIDAWMNDFADSAVYRWNNLDSLIGKPAITDYWKKRRTDAIDSMSFTSDIWLPVKVTEPGFRAHEPGRAGRIFPL